MKRAFITGVSGQDGSYLSEFLLKKGYEVHGIVRRNSDFTSRRIDHILYHPRFITHHGDLIDSSNFYRLLSSINPDEIYNLGAQSHVGLSFDLPDYSANVDGLGVLRLLTVVRDLKLSTRIYQASTSELFGGLPGSEPQSENSTFNPQSPYATSKLFAYWITRNFRDAYGMYISNGILFNHESPRRGKTFVTKKISQAVAKIYRGEKYLLKLGSYDTRRDWGYAKEYVEAMWQILQLNEPVDLVLGTGESHSVREFIEVAFRVIGKEVIWKGNGFNEKGYCSATGQLLVELDPFYTRPNEVHILQADSKKAFEMIGWKPKTSFIDLVKLMVEYDINYDNYGYPDSVGDSLEIK
jgi:GDPmannose 4,6-dehydratase